MSVQLTAARARWLAQHVLPVEPALRAWLTRRVGIDQDVDDVIQETWAIVAALADVTHIERPASYVFQVAKSVVLQQLRRAQVVSIEAVADIERIALHPDAYGPERQVSSRQELMRVAALIDRLPTKCREAFILRRVEGYSQREIAARMGVTEGTVEKHIGKALRLMMDWMQVDDAVTAAESRPQAGRRHAHR